MPARPFLFGVGWTCWNSCEVVRIGRGVVDSCAYGMRNQRTQDLYDDVPLAMVWGIVLPLDWFQDYVMDMFY